MISSASEPSDAAKTAIRENLELDAGVQRLGRMAGIASITRNLETEDAAYKLGPDDDSEPVTAGADDMHIMAARDVIVQQPTPSPTTEPAPSPEPTPAPANSGMSTTAKIATSLAAAALLGPGGVGVASLLGAFDQPA
ncbi:MAG TPA: hypothetical protein VMX74_09085, partial [Pirellulales bacterium]|nr:hypothetical protein [Pirellulales bacterium]